MTDNVKDLANALKAQMAGLSPAPNFIWPNTGAEPPTDGTEYVEVGIFLNPPSQTTIDGKNQRTGVIQADIITPTGRGDSDGYDTADLISALFPANTRLLIASGRYLRTTRDPEVRGGIETARGWSTLVSVYFTTLS